MATKSPIKNISIEQLVISPSKMRGMWSVMPMYPLLILRVTAFTAVWSLSKSVLHAMFMTDLNHKKINFFVGCFFYLPMEMKNYCRQDGVDPSKMALTWYNISLSVRKILERTDCKHHHQSAYQVGAGFCFKKENKKNK